MRTIWKFSIPVTDDIFELEMPKGATLVHVGMATEEMPMNMVWLWAIVETTADKEIRRFVIHGTGHPINPKDIYVGTAYEYDKPLVWHLFEVSAVEFA